MSARTRLSRLLLIPRLRARMQVVRVVRSYTTFYAVECSNEELGALASITSSEISHLGKAMRSRLGTWARIPRLRLLCFGRRADLHKTPSGLRTIIAEPFGRGVWIRELMAAVAIFDDQVPIRRIVIHELAHALTDLLSGGFPYPLALQEGLARSAEYGVRDQTGRSEWDKIADTRPANDEHRYLRDDQIMTINDLLTFDLRQLSQGDRISAYAKMVNLSFWLHAFLGNLVPQRAILKTMLLELRKNNLRSPEGVYRWLQEHLCMDEAELEGAFRLFCTVGAIPQLRCRMTGED